MSRNEAFKGNQSIPEDMEKHFKAGQPMFRGETRFVPEHVNTPSAIVDHLFQRSGPEIGKSWSLDEGVADKFAHKDSMNMVNVPQPEGTTPVEVLMHSKVDPQKVSFDSGSVTLLDGTKQEWDRKTWRQRVSGGTKGKGVYNESEVLMREGAPVPIHGVTIKHGGKLNHFQFNPPITSSTNGQFVTDRMS